MIRLRATHRPRVAAVFLLCGLMLWLGTPTSHAGNRQAVEERTEELGELNKQAVGQIPEELPENGQIEVTAEVVEEQGTTKVKVQEYSITRGKILRNNQKQGGEKGGTTQRGIPRYDPMKH